MKKILIITSLIFLSSIQAQESFEVEVKDKVLSFKSDSTGLMILQLNPEESGELVLKSSFLTKHRCESYKKSLSGFVSPHNANTISLRRYADYRLNYLYMEEDEARYKNLEAQVYPFGVDLKSNEFKEALSKRIKHLGIRNSSLLTDRGVYFADTSVNIEHGEKSILSLYSQEAREK